MTALKKRKEDYTMRSTEQHREIVMNNVKKLAQAKYYQLRAQGCDHATAFAETIQAVVLHVI